MLNEQQIVELLAKAGTRGMTCKKLAKHLYNANNSLFETLSFDDIYRELQAYFYKKTKTRNSYIEKTGQWGYYRLNVEKLNTSLGWLIDYNDEEKEQAEEKNNTVDNTRYLSLFD